MLEDRLRDAASGHNVVGTVYADCMSMYRADGPEHLRPVGETEFALGAGALAAAMSVICISLLGETYGQDMSVETMTRVASRHPQVGIAVP